MKELGPSAKQLIESGKSSMDPTSADEARVLDALRVRIAAGGSEPGQPGPATSPPPAPAPLWPMISAGVVGAGLLTGALLWGLSERPAPPPAGPPPTERPSPAAPADQPSKTDLAAPTPAPTPTPAAENDGGSAAPQQKARSNRLAEEVALLSRATTALHAGRAEEALRVATEHQQKFPGGLLSEERIAVRAQALCMLGRTAEAKRDLARLSPSSPQGARARQRCGLE